MRRFRVGRRRVTFAKGPNFGGVDEQRKRDRKRIRISRRERNVCIYRAVIITLNLINSFVRVAGRVVGTDGGKDGRGNDGGTHQ